MQTTHPCIIGCIGNHSDLCSYFDDMCKKAIEISAHILRSKSILAMTRRASTGKMWGYNLCFLRCLAVEHEWDETSSSLVFVKDTNRRRFPPQQVTFRLYSLWQEKRADYEDDSPRDFPGVTLRTFGS